MLRKNKRAIKEDESLPTIDPSFPLSLLLQQEEFIFGDEEIENEEKAARDGKPSREETNEELNLTKWDLYERRVFKLSKLLARKSKTLQRKTGAEAELFRYQIYVIKWTILQIFEEVKQESIQDTRFPQLLNASNNETESNLEGGGGAGGLVDVDRIVCSKCGGVDTPGNDILLCDKVNCCRAYHQNCLEPRVDVSLIKDEPYWFCWVCDTVNNCLSWLNKKLGTEFDRPEAVFPEVSSESNNEELMRTWASKFPPGSYDPERPTPSTAQGAPADGSNPSSTKRKYKKKPGSRQMPFYLGYLSSLHRFIDFLS